MAKLGIDVSQVKSPFTPLPENNYTFKVVGQELTKSKKAGDAMLQLDYEVVGHPELAGRKLRNWAMLEGAGEQGGKYVIHQHCLIANDDPNDPDPETWLNSEFEAEVTIEEGDRGPQNRITILVNVAELYEQLQEAGEPLGEAIEA